MEKKQNIKFKEDNENIGSKNLNKVIKKLNNNLEITDEKTLLTKAKNLKKQKKYFESLITYKKILKTTKTQNKILLKISKILYLQRKYKKSLKICKKVLESSKNNKKALLTKAKNEKNLKQHINSQKTLSKLLKASPNCEKALLTKGQNYFHLFKYEKSLTQYNKILSQNPKNLEALVEKANTLSELQNSKKSFKILDQVLKQDKKNIFAWRNKGIILSDLKRYDEALECFDKGLEIDHMDYCCLINKGLVLSILGRGFVESESEQSESEQGTVCEEDEESLDCESLEDLDFFDVSEQEEEKDWSVFFDGILEDFQGFGEEEEQKEDLQYGRNLERNFLSDEEEGENQTKKMELKKYFMEALSLYNKAIKILPNSIEAHYNKALLYDDYKNTKKAIKYYKQALKIDKNDTDTLYNLALAYQNTNKLYKALKINNKILFINPKDDFKNTIPDTYNNKGLILDELEYYEEAIKNFNKGIQIAKNIDYLYTNKGISLSNLGKFKQAIFNFDKSLKIEKNFDAYFNKAINLKYLNRYEDSISFYKKSLTLKQDVDSYYNIGQIYLNSLKNYKQSIFFTKKALELDNQNLDAYINLALAYKFTNNFSEALKNFEKAIQIEKKENEEDNFENFEEEIEELEENENLRYNKAYCLQKLGRSDEAIEFYKKAISIDEIDLISYLSLAELFLRLDDVVKSKEFFFKGLEIKKNEKDLSDFDPDEFFEMDRIIFKLKEYFCDCEELKNYEYLKTKKNLQFLKLKIYKDYIFCDDEDQFVFLKIFQKGELVFEREIEFVKKNIFKIFFQDDCFFDKELTEMRICVGDDFDMKCDINFYNCNSSYHECDVSDFENYDNKGKIKLYFE